MIEKGRPWGTVVARPDDLVAAPSDAALAELVAGGAGRPLTVTGGDLHRTLGSPRPPSGPTVRRIPVDLLRVELDDERLAAVAHVVARRPGRTGWWRGPIRAVFNASFLGRWDVAPKGHPNDGRAEEIEVDPTMTLRQRWEARRRLPTGTHLPHPDVRLARRSAVVWELAGDLEVHLDGRMRGRPHVVRITVAPDAYELYV